MTVSREQMVASRSILRSADANDTLAPNFRPTQRLNGRDVFACHEELDALRVDKNTEPNEEEQDASANCDEKDRETQKWFIIAITFICAFAVVIIAITTLCFYARMVNAATPTNVQDKGYKTAPNEEAVEMVTH